MSATAYEKLEDRFRRLLVLGEAESLLHWDQSTMMPPGGAESRGEQLAALKAVRHQIIAAPETAELLNAAGDGDGLDTWQRANLAEMRRHWVHAAALDEDLVVALARTVSACETVWRTAREQSDFAMVRPHLEAVLSLIREAAQAKAEALGLDPYDALLDQWEPGGRAAEIDVLFAELDGFLPGFLAEVLEHQAARPQGPRPQGPFPVERQKALGERLMRTLGFDFDQGRLDVGLHPFCGGTVDDVRITTRYDEDDFTQGFLNTMHELGHGLYKQGLPAAWRRQPVGKPRGMSVEESQSLLIEMQLCRSRPFIQFAAPLMREAFGGDGPEWQAEALHRLFTRVEPGFIRVEADEVTYPLHVILRYRLERAMIAGDLAIADLPAAWNEAMARNLGVTPPDDRRGCLQDIHWFCGAWGYFPTYTIGAVAAAQLFDAAGRADPAIADGDFAPLLAWLRTNVHGLGSSATADEILVGATGRSLDAEAFRAHLRRRYLDGDG
jgi:carboxypeptidase Taq